MSYPRMVRIKQRFDGPRVGDIVTAVATELDRIGVGKRIRPGQSVAITAGSRGIANIAVMIHSIIECCRRWCPGTERVEGSVSRLQAK